MIQLSKEETLNRYKAYLSKIHPIKPIQQSTQLKINQEIIKAVKEIESHYPHSIGISFHYNQQSPDLWRNIVMTFLIEYNNRLSKTSFKSFEILDYYRIIEIYLGQDEQYQTLLQVNTPILFISSEMPTKNKELEPIVMQLIHYRNSLSNSKSNPHQTILLTTKSSQWTRANTPQIQDAFPYHYNINQ